MYIDPKAHKPEKNYPGRLISTGCNTYIKNLSVLTAHELEQVKLDHNLQDTNELLRELEKLNESEIMSQYEEILHVSFDIEAMFPNIPEEMGMEECRKHLDRREEPLFSTECILDGIKITLHNNLTEFNGEMHRQTSGTAIGGSNACPYADTTVSKIDKMIYDLIEGWFANTGLKLPFYKRYRDDIYIPWVYGLEALQRFSTWLNSIHYKLKFTMSEPSLEGTEFLDTYIYNVGHKLHTKVHSKPCDSHSYLVPTSCHATHVIENIPKGVVNRLFRISSEQHNYEITKNEFTNYLLARGYNENLIKEAFVELENKDRLELIGYKHSECKKPSRGKCYPLIIDFNPALPNMTKIINKHKYLLGLDPELIKVIPTNSIFVTFRRAKNIQDILVHSKLKSPIEQNTGTMNKGQCKNCESNRCVFHKYYLNNCTEFSSHHTNQKFMIENDIIDCDTRCIIYLASCKVCKVSNVGFTTNSIKERVRAHKNHIKKSIHSCELASHFIGGDSTHIINRTGTNQEYDISLSKYLEFILIEKVNTENCVNIDEKVNKCKEREQHWQHQLRTLEIYGGMNKREEKVRKRTR